MVKQKSHLVVETISSEVLDAYDRTMDCMRVTLTLHEAHILYQLLEHTTLPEKNYTETVKILKRLREAGVMEKRFQEVGKGMPKRNKGDIK